MVRRLIRWVAALALWPLLAQAEGEAPRPSALPAADSKIVVFGDGRSNDCFFGRLSGSRYPPSPPFFGRRWTSGQTLIEVLAAQGGWRFEPKDNRAQGGATTGGLDINVPLREKLGIPADVPIVDALARIERAAATPGAIDPQALHVVWAGSHETGAST